MRVDELQPERGEGVIGPPRRRRVAARLVDAGVVVEFRRRLGVGDDAALAVQPRESLLRVGGGGRLRRRFRARLRPRGGLRDRRRLGRRLRPEDHERHSGRDESGPAEPGQPGQPDPARRLVRHRPPRRIARDVVQLARPGDRVGVHRLRDVLERALADVAEGHRHLVGHRLVHRARHADAARIGDAFQPRGDVDSVAEEIGAALDHVADGDADAELQAAAWRVGAVAGAQRFLDVDGGAHRLHGAVERAHDGVAGRVEDAAAVALDEVVEHLAMRGEAAQRLLLVLGDETRVAGDVRRQDGRDPALHERSHRPTLFRMGEAASRPRTSIILGRSSRARHLRAERSEDPKTS